MSTIMRKPVDPGNQPADAADPIFDAIHEVMHLYRGMRRGGAGGTAELPHMEAKVLGFFARNPGAAQGELVAHSGRDKSQVARLIAGLRQRGLLEAQADPEDRRSVRLRLTPEGQSMHRALKAQARRRARAAVGDLSAHDCRQLLGLLARIRDNLERDAA
jgi:DNA-binding MarR family transcriptional regulator